MRRLGRRALALTLAAFGTCVVVTLALAATTLALREGGDARGEASAQRDVKPPAGAGARILPPEQPPLIEVLQAADELVRAGAMPAPAAPPPLIEVLQAANQLVYVGAMEAPPPLIEVLEAANEFVEAGLIEAPPAEPTFTEVLVAADVLVRAGVLTPPSEQREEPRASRRERSEPEPVPTAAPTEAPPPPPPPVEPTSAPPPPPPAAPSTSVDAAFSQQVFDAVNALRTRSGLAPVAVDARLTRAASDYADVLSANDWFSHTGPDGSTMVTRIEAAGFPFTVPVGEVLAWGTMGWQPAEIAQAWLDSPAHREQILNATYTRAGLSCSSANGAVRCVMDLAG